MAEGVMPSSYGDEERALAAAGGSRGLLVTLAGRYLCRRDRAVASATVVRVLGDCGVREHAARSLLVRMVQEGWFERHRRGRQSYVRPSAEFTARLLAGRRRVYRQEPVVDPWAGVWTLLSFSLPEQRRADRHRIRSRLRWEGFAPLRNGLWISPSERSLDGHLGALLQQADGHGFFANLRAPNDAGVMLERAWNLGDLAEVYRGFLERWQGPPAPRGNTLPRHLHLIADWRRVLRAAPPLPEPLVPSTWPAVAAWERFHCLEQALGPAAGDAYDELQESIEIPSGEGLDLLASGAPKSAET